MCLYGGVPTLCRDRRQRSWRRHISPYLPISQALEELEAEPVPEGCCREVFVLPAAAWGRVKGQGNMGLQRLRERAGCKVVAHLRPPDRFPQCKARRCSPAAAGRARRLFTARAVNRRCYSSGRGRRLMAQSGCCAKRSAVTRGRETYPAKTQPRPSRDPAETQPRRDEVRLSRQAVRLCRRRSCAAPPTPSPPSPSRSAG